MFKSVARLTRFLPRFMQPKFFVMQYYSMPPDIWTMRIYKDRDEDRNEKRIQIKNVTYWEAEAFIKMLPNGGRLPWHD